MDITTRKKMETETVKTVKLDKQGRCLYMLHEVTTPKGDVVFSNKFYMGIQFDSANGVTEEEAEQFTCHVQTAVNSHYELLEASKELWMHVKLNNKDASAGNYDPDSVFGKIDQAIFKATS